MSLISELCEEHRQVEEQAAMLLRIVSAEVPDSAMVAATRWRLAQMLHDHCVREDRWVYERLITSGDKAAIDDAWRYRQDHGRIAPGFASYIAAWPVQRVASEWQGFREATRAALTRIAERVALEEQCLYAHLARVEARRVAA